MAQDHIDGVGGAPGRLEQRTNHHRVVEIEDHPGRFVHDPVIVHTVDPVAARRALRQKAPQAVDTAGVVNHAVPEPVHGPAVIEKGLKLHAEQGAAVAEAVLHIVGAQRIGQFDDVVEKCSAYRWRIQASVYGWYRFMPTSGFGSKAVRSRPRSGPPRGPGRARPGKSGVDPVR